MKVINTTLPNKLKVTIIPDKNSFSVSIMVLVKVGSRYEQDQNAGIAHFVEHMFFKGTKNRPTSKEIGMAIENIGGSSNAFTSYDYTGYYIKAPKEAFTESLTILADMIKNGIFAKEEIEKERGVIIEEIRMYEDRPMSKVRSVWFSEFFKDFTLGREITGSVETVNGVKQQDFLDFIKSYYVGQNMLVAVAGGIGEEEALSAVSQYFGDINQGKESDFERYTVQSKKSNIINLKKPIEQSHLILGCFGPEREYEAKYSIKVANAILSEGFGSRLFQVIRDQLGLAYYVYASLNPFDETGVLNVGMGVENSKVAIAVKSVIEEIRSIIQGNFDDEELERAKNFLIGNLVTDMESSDDIAFWYGLQNLLNKKVDTIEEVKREIKKIAKKDAIEEMQKNFKGQPILLTGVTPHDKLPSELLDYLVL